MSPAHERNKGRAARFSAALRSGNAQQIKQSIHALFAPGARIQMGLPFGQMHGPEALWEQVYEPLLAAMPVLERRDFIRMAGPRWNATEPQDWVGLGGNFIGTLHTDWLGIPAHAAPVFMRYHEYQRYVGDHVVEMQALWDLPQIMAQVGVWPMPPKQAWNGCAPVPERASA